MANLLLEIVVITAGQAIQKEIAGIHGSVGRQTVMLQHLAAIK